MKFNNDTLDTAVATRTNIPVGYGSKRNVPTTSDDLIRFEGKKDEYRWVAPNEICFVQSADHYVKSLIKCGLQMKWMSRHSTLKELLDLLPDENFIRLNKFYLLNRLHFSHLNESTKLLYFNDTTCIAVPHRISPYLCHILKSYHS